MAIQQAQQPIMREVESTGKPRNESLKWLSHWFEPKSTDRDIAFRESTIRTTVAILGVLSAISLIASRLIYRQEWSLLSYSTVILIGLALSIASAVAIARQRVTVSAWLLVATFMMGGVGILMVEGRHAPLIIPVLLLVVIVAALVLPRSNILPVSGIAIVTVSIISFLQEQAGVVSTTQPSVNVYGFWINTAVMLLMEGLLLRTLLSEFDGRLDAMLRAKEQAEQARHEADRANRAKSQFLANMSHELRTPLNAIVGYVEIMLSGMVGAFTERQTQLQHHILTNAKRLLLLINDILDLAKIEAGRMDIRLAPMSPRQTISEVVNSMQSLADKKQISLTTCFADDTPDVVLGDAGKLQQIVTNLVSNAIKFTSQGGVEVNVGLAPEADHWQIRVIDTGTGMPADAKDYIFEMFRQVDSTDTRQHEGTGLGLAITKQLVDRMNGRIDVETQLGKGSIFTVTLPRQTHELALAENG